jgi:acetyl-CoA carboxylase biotin carboxyl carrier protein
VAKRKKPAKKAARKVVKPRAARADNRSDDVLEGIGLTELRRLIRLVRSTGIGELEITAAGKAVRISAQAGVSVVPAGGQAVMPLSPHGAPSAGPASDSPRGESPAEAAADKYVAITSPMVGTFYRAPSPDVPSFVDVGTRIAKGDPLCIIEAMKLMNELEADIEGTIAEICVTNGEPVEYGQLLFRVDPA